VLKNSPQVEGQIKLMQIREAMWSEGKIQFPPLKKKKKKTACRSNDSIALPLSVEEGTACILSGLFFFGEAHLFIFKRRIVILRVM